MLLLTKEIYIKSIITQNGDNKLFLVDCIRTIKVSAKYNIATI